MMKTKSLFCYLIGLLALMPAGCSDEDAPVSTPPTLISEEAADITRTTATLSGSIQAATGTSIKEFGLEYSTVSAMPEENSTRVRLTYTASQQRYSVPLESLTPNTTYYYRFYATNGHNSVYSEKQSFDTKSDDVPTLSTVTIGTVTESTAALQCRFLDEGGSTIQSYGFAYRLAGSDAEEKQVQAADKDKEGYFTATLTGLEDSSEYEIRAYAINTRGTGYSEAVTMSTAEPEVPLIRMGAVTTDYKSVTLSASIQNETDLTRSITEVGFYIGLEEHAEPDDTDRKHIVELEGNTFSTTITDLEQSTTYYIRAYAVNKGTVIGYSSTISVTTERSVLPSLATVTIVVAGEKTLTLRGTVTDRGGHDISQIGYGLKTSVDAEETRKELLLESLAEDGTFEFSIADLAPDASYMVRTYAVNPVGTGYSEYLTVSTQKQSLPVVEAVAGTVTSSSIAVTGKVTDKGGAAAVLTETGFVYSTTNETPELGNGTAVKAETGEEFTATLNGLSQGTTYYIRAYAKNDTQTGYSDVSSVTTARSTQPALGMVTVTNIKEGSADVQAQITDTGGNDILAIGFAYKSDTGTEMQVSVDLSKLTNNNTFNYTLTGLSPNTTYQVRGYASNSAGAGYGDYVSFTTTGPIAPKLTATASLKADSTAAPAIHAEGVITSAGSENSTVQEVGFCWSTTHTEPTITDSRKQATLSGRAFASDLYNLRAETTYYVRAYAVNESMTGYSDVIVITTPTSDVPDPDDNPSPDVE